MHGIAAESLVLPDRIIGVLHRQRWQWIGMSAQKCGIQRAELLEQHAHRPGIGHQMVHRHQQHVLLVVQTQQMPADQRAVREIERPARLVARACVDACGRLCVAAQIRPLQGESGYFENALPDLALHLDQTGAQHFVSLHDPVQRGVQGVFVEAAVQAQSARQVIGGAATWVEPCQKPQALLCERGRQRLQRSIH